MQQRRFFLSFSLRLNMRFFVGTCWVLAFISTLGWLAGVGSRALLWPMLLFGGLAFLGWAGGAGRRPRTLNDRVRLRQNAIK